MKKRIKVGDTFQGDHGEFYAVMDAPMNGDANYLYVANLTEKVVIKSTPEAIAQFFEDMTPIDIGMTAFEKHSNKKIS